MPKRAIGTSERTICAMSSMRFLTSSMTQPIEPVASMQKTTSSRLAQARDVGRETCRAIAETVADAGLEAADTTAGADRHRAESGRHLNALEAAGLGLHRQGDIRWRRGNGLGRDEDLGRFEFDLLLELELFFRRFGLFQQFLGPVLDDDLHLWLRRRQWRERLDLLAYTPGHQRVDQGRTRQQANPHEQAPGGPQHLSECVRPPLRDQHELEDPGLRGSLHDA